ncbi:hypothetical protein ACFLSZ_05360 [Candidatus Bipolaricaulota bacterium]
MELFPKLEGSESSGFRTALAAALFLIPVLFVASDSGTAQSAVLSQAAFTGPSFEPEVLVQDWLISPHDMVVANGNIYVSANLDGRIAALRNDGQLIQYFSVDFRMEGTGVCLAALSDGRVFAASSLGIWELGGNGTARQLAQWFLNVDAMASGPDNKIYVAYEQNSNTNIAQVGLDGSRSVLMSVPSHEVSALIFDQEGNLLIADSEHGRVLRYSEARGLEVMLDLGSVLYPGGCRFYMAFDNQGTLFISGLGPGLMILRSDGKLAHTGVYVTGDLEFAAGHLYALETFTSSLLQITLDGQNVAGARVLRRAQAPWQIETAGDVIIGERRDSLGREFSRYYLGDSIRIERHDLLSSLDPDQFTLDSSGNLYVAIDGVLSKLTSEGAVAYSVSMPGTVDQNTRLAHRASDDHIYYFDSESNSIWRIAAGGAQVYHTLSSLAERTMLAFTSDGGVYAAVIFEEYVAAALLDITDPPREKKIWDPGEVAWFHLAAHPDGYLLAAIGAYYQGVFVIEPVIPVVVPIYSASIPPFVDPQGFAVTGSGDAILSAPGLLILYRQTDKPYQLQCIEARSDSGDEASLCWNASIGTLGIAELTVRIAHEDSLTSIWSGGETRMAVRIVAEHPDLSSFLTPVEGVWQRVWQHTEGTLCSEGYLLVTEDSAGWSGSLWIQPSADLTRLYIARRGDHRDNYLLLLEL